jgi:hypothetical protein
VRAKTQTDLQHGSPSPPAIGTDNNAPLPSNKTAINLLITNAGLCIFWALLAGKSREDWLDLPFVKIMGFNQYWINPIITFTTIIAFALQACTII